MTPKDTVKAHGELRALDLSDQAASFLIFLAFRTLWAEERWCVSRDTPKVRMHRVACRGHCVVVSVCCVERVFVISMFRMEVELRVSMSTVKNLSQPGAK